MSFIEVYLKAFLVIFGMMTLLWAISVRLKNASIVDIFWGFGFVLLTWFYFFQAEGWPGRKILILTLVTLWGLRLTIFLAWRNAGKGEDFRYQEFRRHYGPKRYWWFSFFQVFLLQGVLMWLISAPLLGAQFYGLNQSFGVLDVLGTLLWVIGIIFEAGGDFQLARFKSKAENQGKVLDKGLWRYTRHPNYFGDTAVWWGFGLICLAGGSYWPFYGTLLMTFLIIRVSGVILLEKSLKDKKPEYLEYIRKTSAFIPWFPKR